jgi:hypothetical protein
LTSEGSEASEGSAFGWVVIAFIVLALVVITLLVLNSMSQKPRFRERLSPIMKGANAFKNMTVTFRTPMFGSKKEGGLLDDEEGAEYDPVSPNDYDENSNEGVAFENPVFGKPLDTDKNRTAEPMRTWPSTSSMSSYHQDPDSRVNSASDLTGLTSNTDKSKSNFYRR